ncbi:DUF4166 domain-containing protein [Solwaraspora sp. WMMD406]|uniref:DUF4166 domain-containing protein n=1 Tax=Solwaraspora sp. WMMD406 TaxID=3016095 RepID=UPI0024172E4D|nr:DUF4166 domain-containing protein [Solwaraspora sp. WMMD406]MDG4767946.1 DUF4166 domain-containing protein [Solwaraspora sp. WMMD406]
MTSIFQQALGRDFDRLHPRLRQRFGISSARRTACVGTGVMDRIWHGPAVTVPLLRLGATRHILFPEQGTDIAFRIENYAYRDSYGRETVSFVRTFDVAAHRRRRFDATMVYSPASGAIVDYLGTHQHYAVLLHLTVDRRGGLIIRTGEQRYAGHRFPVALSGRAQVHEWWDDAEDSFRIEVRVTNRFLGPVFGYRGRFTAQYVDTGTAPVPAAVRPLRENAQV